MTGVCGARLRKTYSQSDRRAGQAMQKAQSLLPSRSRKYEKYIFGPRSPGAPLRVCGTQMRLHVMDRLTRRWIVAGLAFALCLAVGLWMTLPQDRATGSTPIVQRSSMDEQPIREHSSIAGKISADIAPAAAEPTVAGGIFRGQIIDAITRAPVREFEVKLVYRRPVLGLSREPPPQTFEAADGRFTWSDAPSSATRRQ